MCNRQSCGIFDEAISHCRWKSVLKSNLKKIKIKSYKNKTFNHIIIDVNNKFKNVKGVGLLTVYDITAALCRYYNINISKIYIIGNGPKRAVNILNLKVKSDKISSNLTLKYVEINEVKKSFNKMNYKLEKALKYEKNGDVFESYLCNWQKDK